MQLATQLHEATGIDRDLLRYGLGQSKQLSDYNIAQRMSWASQRTTTRPEDLAYCLFGLFDINLTPLYGEGAAKAFLRLQEEIIRTSLDLSFLAWERTLDMSRTYTHLAGALATSPAHFRTGCHVLANEAVMLDDQEPFSLTNKGLYVHLYLLKSSIEEDTYIALLPLNDTVSGSLLGIGLFSSPNSTGNVFQRQCPKGENSDLYHLPWDVVKHAKAEWIFIAR